MIIKPFLVYVGEVKLLANNTIEEVIATESKAIEVAQEYNNKIAQLETDKQEKIESWKAASQSNLKEFEDLQRSETQIAFASFETEKNEEQQAQLATLRNHFSLRKDELVGYVVEEVKKIYGNR